MTYLCIIILYYIIFMFLYYNKIEIDKYGLLIMTIDKIYF